MAKGSDGTAGLSSTPAQTPFSLVQVAQAGNGAHWKLAILRDRERGSGRHPAGPGPGRRRPRLLASVIDTIVGSPSGPIPFTPQAEKLLELSLPEALQLGHNYIDTEHILLGLTREDEGVAAQVLVRLGADPNRARGP